MNALLKELEENGILVDEGVERFLYNEALYLKYLKKFSEDKDMKKLIDALENDDLAEAFHAAHALKSTTGSLAIDCLYQKSKPIVETLRGGAVPDEQLITEFREDYERIIKVISKC